MQLRMIFNYQKQLKKPPYFYKKGNKVIEFNTIFDEH